MTHLDTLRPLLAVIARERTAARPDLYDDALQEGMIRAWSVEQEKPDAPREYVLAAARNAIGDVARGRPALGAASHRGRQDAADTAIPLVQRDPDGEEAELDVEDASAALAMRQAESAAARWDIAAAVASLPVGSDIELVARRFWGDQDYRSIAADMGVKHTALERRWAGHIRPHLREHLAHLADAA